MLNADHAARAAWVPPDPHTPAGVPDGTVSPQPSDWEGMGRESLGKLPEWATLAVTLLLAGRSYDWSTSGAEDTTVAASHRGAPEDSFTGARGTLAPGRHSLARKEAGVLIALAEGGRGGADGRAAALWPARHAPVPLVAAMLIWIALGCGAPSTEPGPRTARTGDGEAAGLVRTDSASYRLHVRPTETAVTITATVTNHTAAPVYVLTCAGFGSALAQLEKRVGETWQVAFRPVCLMIAGSPIELKPSETYRDMARIRALEGHLPEFKASEIPGTYRAVYSIFRSWNQADQRGEGLSGTAIISNEFRIEP